jgi:hypothetical protein
MEIKVDNPNNKISKTKYENFFNMYRDDAGFNFYNILKNITVLPAKDSSVEDEYIIRPTDTWIFIAYKYYDNMNLWWLVCEYNQVKNAVEMPPAGTKIRLLRPEFVSVIIDELNRQTKR